MTSPNGVDWSEPSRLAFGPEGHYEISWPGRARVGAALNIMPGLKSIGFERTNLYYVETRDFGESWVTVDGRRLETPIVTEQNPALLRDYRKEGMHVYLKDLQFDEHDLPVIVYLTSRGWASGPKNDPRSFQLERWTGNKWEFLPVMWTDHNYDFGSLYLEQEDRWRFIAPTRAARQPYVTGGEIDMWISRDKGISWKREKELTRNSRDNHSYVRRPLRAHPDFYALWADGDALAPSVTTAMPTIKEMDLPSFVTAPSKTSKSIDGTMKPAWSSACAQFSSTIGIGSSVTFGYGLASTGIVSVGGTSTPPTFQISVEVPMSPGPIEPIR